MAVIPKRPKRCKRCKKIITTKNKSGYCSACISNEYKKERKRKKCYICEEPCCGKLLIEWRKTNFISLCASHFNRLLLIQDPKKLRKEIKRLKGYH